jgi:hypothetical protein
MATKVIAQTFCCGLIWAAPASREIVMQNKGGLHGGAL